MSAVTMSGETNDVRPPDTRGLTNGQIRVTENSPSKTETVQAAKQPAAIINEGIERLLLRGSARVVDESTTKAGRTEVEVARTQDQADSAASFDHPSKSMLANHVQSQIASNAEIAILAQAKQLPNEAMAYSASE